jgi:hypothetical protein
MFRWLRDDSASVSCAVVANEENWGMRDGKCRAIVDHAVRGREELGGKYMGRWSNGDEVELDSSLSRGIFWWVENNISP